MKKKLAFLCALLALTLASCQAPSHTDVTEDTDEPVDTVFETEVYTESEPIEVTTEEVTEEVYETTAVSSVTSETTTAPHIDEPPEFNYRTSELDGYIMLGKYLGIEVFVEPWDVISEEQLDIELELYIEQLLIDAAIYEGVCKDGDTVNISVIGTLDGNEFFGGDGEGYTLTLGKYDYILNIDSDVVGMAVGETRRIMATFPGDYGSAEYNGKTAVFDVTLNYIYPTLTDKFVSENTEFESVKALRAYIRDRAKAEAKQMLSDAVLTKAMANSYIIGLPEAEVEKAYANLVGANRALANQLGMSYADFIMQSYGIAEDEADMIFEDLAMNDVAQKLLIYAIARDMKLDVSEGIEYSAIFDGVLGELVKNANYVETLAN